ncbi:MAG: peptidylprolyl isomerase [Candidatus Bathyarchaeia archaeon]
MTLETSMGNIVIQLYDDKAPITVTNFLSYVKAGFYDGTVFHRVMLGFVIQGGGFSVNGTEKATNAPIKLESNNSLSNLAGTIAMARSSDSNSATSQFYINLVDSKNLDYSASNPGYAVFGKVISGMDVVNQISKVQTGTRNIYLPVYNQTIPYDNWPIQDIVINRCYISNNDQSAQAQTQVRIDSVTWGSTFSQLTGVDVRNTGSVDATLESVSIRVNSSGSQAYVLTVTNAIGTGAHMTIGPIAPTGFTWAHSTSYVIRVTTNTGFYYESVFTSPA